MITGAGATVCAAIVEHPGIDKIAFTDDTGTGKAIMRSAADTLKKIALEHYTQIKTVWVDLTL